MVMLPLLLVFVSLALLPLYLLPLPLLPFLGELVLVLLPLPFNPRSTILLSLIPMVYGTTTTMSNKIAA